MPGFRHRDATLYYEEARRGFPILTFAPAGLQSTIGVWDHPEARPAVLDAFYRNMSGSDFVYCADRAFAATCRTPCLVLAGNDVPRCAFIPEWKTGPALASARACVREFFLEHTPAG